MLETKRCRREDGEAVWMTIFDKSIIKVLEELKIRLYILRRQKYP